MIINGQWMNGQPFSIIHTWVFYMMIYEFFYPYYYYLFVVAQSKRNNIELYHFNEVSACSFEMKSSLFLPSVVNFFANDDDIAD